MAKKKQEVDFNNISLDALAKLINEAHGADTIMQVSAAKAADIPRLYMNTISLDYETGGIPIGRVTNIFGETSGGKTTLATMVVARSQKICPECLIEREPSERKAVVCPKCNGWREVKNSKDEKKYLICESCTNIKIERARKRGKNIDKIKPIRRKGGYAVGVCPSCGGTEGFSAIYFDSEGTWSKLWARKLGVNLEKIYLIRPEYAEIAADIVDISLRNGNCNLVVIDTIAMLTPGKEIEESASKWQQGLQARIVGKMIRKILSATNNKKLSTEKRPTVLMLNQMRMKIGIMWGDPNIRPGGKAQKYAGSLDIKVKTPKFGHDKDGNTIWMLFQYLIYKNKTAATAKMDGNFRIWLREHGGHYIGDTEEPIEVFKTAMKYNIIKEVKKGKAKQYSYKKKIYKTKKEIIERIKSDYNFYRVLRDEMLGKVLGVIHRDKPPKKKF